MSLDRWLTRQHLGRTMPPRANERLYDERRTTIRQSQRVAPDIFAALVAEAEAHGLPIGAMLGTVLAAWCALPAREQARLVDEHRPRLASADALPARLSVLLRSRRDPWTGADLARATGAKLASVNSVLSRMVGDGEAIRVARGTYAAAR